MMLPPLAKWKEGSVTGGVRCNNKIIGAMSFFDDNLGPNDKTTHVASNGVEQYLVGGKTHKSI